jgi:hypothetical protein
MRMSKNTVEPERAQQIWLQRVAYWISKATRVQAHSRARAPTHSHTHMHTYSCPHPRVRAHAHKLFAFSGSSGFVTRKLPVLFFVYSLQLPSDKYRANYEVT